MVVPLISLLAALQTAAAGTSPSDGVLQTESSLRWIDAPPAWITGLVLVPLILAVVWWTYRRESTLSTRQRTLLAALRVLGIAVILLASFRPAIETTRNLKVRTEIHMLVDDSASMGRHDNYQADLADGLRASLDASAPDDLSDLSRIELVSRLLGGGGDDAASHARGPAKEFLDKLNQDFDIRWFRFWDRSYPITTLDELDGKGASTRIGDVLDLHLGSHSVDPTKLEAVVLVTDGRSNEGLAPREGVARLRAAEVPLHILGVGDPSEERNLTLSGPPGPQQVLQNEEAVFELSVTAQGLARKPGQEFDLILRYQKTGAGKGQEGGPRKGVTLSAAPVSAPLPNSGETRKVLVRHSFAEPGDYILTFEVPPLPGETNPKDNTTRRYLRVDSDRIRVLYVEDVPRWDYRYITRALKRVDRSIGVQCWQFDASPQIRQESSEDLPPLSALPRTKSELFKYHVILLGDVPPWRLGATEEARAKWIGLLKEFVEHGGGVGFLAGPSAMPESYRETALEDLLPVVIGDMSEDAVPNVLGDRFRPQLESPHAPHPITKLRDDIDSNKRLWDDGLEGMAWYYPVLRAKAGAKVLLRHPQDQNKYGRRVLAALAPYPKGTVFFCAFDETWRWRNPYGERYVDKFWRNVVRALAENKLRRMDDRVSLTVDHENLDIGGRVRIELQLLDEDYNPVLAESARLHLRVPSGKLQSIVVPRLQGQAGRFETVLPLTEAGVYSLLRYRDGQPQGRAMARQDVIVRIPERELAHTSLDQAGLQELAKAGGGRYAHIANLTTLLPGFRGRGAGIKTVDRKTREIWDRSWTVLLVLLFFTVEWILRKRWRMV